jgi:hypothetical protein
MGFLRALAAGLLLALLGAEVTLAECVPPWFGVSVREAAPNAPIAITGQYFKDRCNDEGGPAFPARDIRILFVQDDRRQEVGRVDANRQFEIPETAVTIPKDAKRGSASIVVETVYGGAKLEIPVSITVTAGK